MEQVCNSSHSLTFNKEGSGSFASNNFNSMPIWFDFFWSAILIYFVILMVMNLAHVFKFSTSLP